MKNDSIISQISSNTLNQLTDSSGYSERNSTSNNAKLVAIQLFCIDEVYECRSHDFMYRVFDLYPEYEYCFIGVPHKVSFFPLLERFVRITPRKRSVYPHELYILAKCSLNVELNISEPLEKDCDRIEYFINTIIQKSEICKDLNMFYKTRSNENGMKMKCYICTVNKQIVGICMIQQEYQHNIDYIRSHYEIDTFIDSEQYKHQDHMYLKNFVMNPAFNVYSKYFLKCVMIESESFCLYHKLNNTEENLIVTCLNQMIIVPSIKTIDYDIKKLNINCPREEIVQPHDNKHILYHLAMKQIYDTKMLVNLKIVVVGASNTGLKLLQNFVYQHHIRFHNLTLISIHPITNNTETLVTKDEHSSDHSMYSLIHSAVNFVLGSIVSINRKNKSVSVLNDEIKSIVYYDYLILTTGQQYVFSENESLGTINLNNVRNAFLVNDSFEESILRMYVTQNIARKKCKIYNYCNSLFLNVVIYGNEIDVYTCIKMLNKWGIDLINIYNIYPDTVINNENNIELRQFTRLLFDHLEIKQYCIKNDNISFELDKIGNIKEIRWGELNKSFIDCDIYISFEEKHINSNIFKALNDACLVFDGRLVIDRTFKTDDNFIYAAGPLTKYKRLYYSDFFLHENFNSNEIALKLSFVILTLLDPIVFNLNDINTYCGYQNEHKDCVLNDFVDPVIHSAELVNKINYFHIKKPYESKLKKIGLKDKNTYYITGSLKEVENVNFMKLTIDEYNTISEIVCISHKTIPKNNIIVMFNHHQILFNNLISRFKEGLITDFYEFFSDSWATAIYHYQFKYFLQEIREYTLNYKFNNHNENFVEEIMEYTHDDRQISDFLKSKYEKIFIEKKMDININNKLLKFIRNRKFVLPMYAEPNMI
ncbi:hypothetical protein A3Q56_03473 [Intoshia linei]|uniref:CFAP61 dimerisation domain-containing protein n=1 Tax=Intoshia linei TaxID=1819745 RepID=A0A177B3C6_9BILA|nr:hypothetical protein A3Q56_03473 [Intoshia linei]